MASRRNKRINLPRSKFKKDYRYAIFGLAILLFHTYYFFIWKPKSEKENKNYDYCLKWSKESISGIIQDIPLNRVYKYLIINDNEFIPYTKCNNEFIFSVGDSLHKPSNSFNLYIYKGANPDSLISLSCDFDCDVFLKQDDEN